MRIIAGKFKSRQIDFLKNEHIRPTKDSIRENIFNTLTNLEVATNNVLDLFCGSGSYGFECLSRGAGHIYFNDINYNVAKLVKGNAIKFGCLDDVTITNKDYPKAIASYINQGIVFDLVFIDPPYYKNHYASVLRLLIPLLSSRSVVIVEKTVHIEYNIPSEYIVIKEKQYQEQVITFLRLKE